MNINPDNDNPITHGKYTSFQAIEIPGQHFNKVGLGEIATPIGQLESDMNSENRGVTKLHDWMIEQGIHTAPKKQLTQDEKDWLRIKNDIHLKSVDHKETNNDDNSEHDDDDDDDSDWLSDDDHEILNQLKILRLSKLKLKKKINEINLLNNTIESIDPKNFYEKVIENSYNQFIVLLIYRDVHTESEILMKALQEFIISYQKRCYNNDQLNKKKKMKLYHHYFIKYYHIK